MYPRQNLLLILAPPRSFSSVVSTVIGQHPDLYGFPELRLFVGDTAEEVIRYSQTKDPEHYVGPPGLLRTLAQLHDGTQTASTILKARDWLEERINWSTKSLFDYLLEKVSPRMGVEKTPATSRIPEFRERAYSQFPQAYYLHLTRHPVSTRKSMLENFEKKEASYNRKRRAFRAELDPLQRWCRIHQEIIDFTSTLPSSQTFRIKGEDLLSEPDRHLPRIAEWLHVSTGQEAIEAMKHPENSLYACLGPDIASGGNNLKFLSNPYLHSGKIEEPSLKSFLAANKGNESESLEFFIDPELEDQATQLAQELGYQ